MRAENILDQGAGAPARRLGARRLALVRQACAYIDSRQGRGITLARLAAQVDLSPWHLRRLFKRAIGVTPRGYADACRGR